MGIRRIRRFRLGGPEFIAVVFMVATVLAAVVWIVFAPRPAGASVPAAVTGVRIIAPAPANGSTTASTLDVTVELVYEYTVEHKRYKGTHVVRPPGGLMKRLPASWQRILLYAGVTDLSTLRARVEALLADPAYAVYRDLPAEWQGRILAGEAIRFEHLPAPVQGRLRAAGITALPPLPADFVEAVRRVTTSAAPAARLPAGREAVDAAEGRAYALAGAVPLRVHYDPAQPWQHTARLPGVVETVPWLVFVLMLVVLTVAYLIFVYPRWKGRS